MPEHLKALPVILILASAAFAFMQQPVCSVAIAPADFSRRRNLWIALTLIAFLAHNFWVYVVVTAIVLAVVAPRDPNRPALYFFVLFAIPQIGQAIPGFGIVNQLFVVDYTRVLALALLLPAAIQLRRQEAAAGERLGLPDKLLLGYLALNIALQFLAISLTGTMRNTFYAFIDVVLPYYVISRSLRDLESFRDAIMSFVVAGIVLAAVGAFEYSRHWLLYYSLDEALGISWDYGGYLERGDSLRAMATAGQPIVLGYVLAVVIGLFLYARGAIRGHVAVAAGFALLLVGELAPISRGPWTGALAIFLVYLATGAKATSNFGKLAAVGVIALPILFMTPYGEKVIDYLPFIGEIDEGNVTYRQRLLELSIAIILENPVFGSADFILFLEEMRQGQGIIDIVNTYLLIALRSGLVGLALFVGFFAVIIVGIAKRMRRTPAESEMHRLGQALIAILIGILIMIFTVSPINVVPVVYWAVAGLGLAYSRLAAPADAR